MTSLLSMPEAGRTVRNPVQADDAVGNAKAPSTIHEIPVIIVTGELGAGKTRFLSRVLAAPGQRPTALLVNEFAQLGIDQDVFKSFGLNAQQISGGCICCTLRSEVRRTLQELLFARARGDVAFEQVVIETSGVTDPASLISEFFEDGVLRRRFRLSGLVTIVDPTTSLKKVLASNPVALRQIALADRLLLSKLDLGGFDLVRTRQILASVNPSAEVSDVQEVESFADLIGPTRENSRSQTSERFETSSDHVHQITSCSIEAGPGASSTDIFRFVQELINRCGDALLRVKGVIKTEDNDADVALVDVVRGRMYPVHRVRAYKIDTRTRAVVIVENIPAAVVTEVASLHRLICCPS